MRYKIGQFTEITAKSLAVMAAAETMPSHVRVAVATAIRDRPELLAELPSLAASVAGAPAADPFVGALRRLCRPTLRLPLRHREALAQAEEEPLGFIELVIDEARTTAWRGLDPRPLVEFLAWLPKSKLAPQDIFRLGGRACEAHRCVATLVALFYAKAYRPSTIAAAVNVVLDQERRWGKAKVIDPKAVGKSSTEGVLGLALARAATEASPQEAERLLESVDSASLRGDDLVLFDLAKAWCLGLLREDFERAEWHLGSALAAVDEDCDPWLELLLRVHLAWVIDTRAEDKIRSLSDLMAARMREMLTRRITNPFGVILSDYQAGIEAGWEHLKPALDHLNAATTLLAEYPAPEMKLRFLELRMKLLVARDLPQAMEDLIDAVVTSKKQPGKDFRADMWITTAMFYKAGLERLLSQPRARAAFERFEARIEPAFQEGYNMDTYGTPYPPSKKKK